jgi:hypothetical protein
MSRARILADYVSSGDELADKAPIDGPTFTGTVAIPNVANLETAVVANTAKVTNYNQTLADINALDVTELGTVTSANLANTAIVYPAGHVIQTIQGTPTTTQTVVATHASDFTAVAGTVSITPKYTNSKFLISFSTGGMCYGIDSAILRIKRDTTVIKYSARYGYNNSGSVWDSVPTYYEYLDTPPSIPTPPISITYSLEARKTAGVWEINSSGGTNSMTAIVMEIAG